MTREQSCQPRLAHTNPHQPPSSDRRMIPGGMKGGQGGTLDLLLYFCPPESRDMRCVSGRSCLKRRRRGGPVAPAMALALAPPASSGQSDAATVTSHRHHLLTNTHSRHNVHVLWNWQPNLRICLLKDGRSRPSWRRTCTRG